MSLSFTITFAVSSVVSVNEKAIHTGRNVRRSGLAAKQHSSTVCAAAGGMSDSMKGETLDFLSQKKHAGKKV